MGMIEELKALGVDADDGIARFGGDSELYIELMEDVVNEIEAHEVLSCFEAGDLDTALANAHCLKGALGNMCMTPLYLAYEEIVKLIRANDAESAKQKTIEMLPVQEKILECIKKYL